ncbi:hypothetical protein N7491_007396 [Penicillium cf. griseofulvum]|uniref:Uncharacterized protein n=1 Tax=Penicillium cf. griseofulvum TaxID=2972120 RepID=A0A9W9M0N4_9EURO|nr:hypothetical protein N7472_009575 [Penicillium cf. griseofulvum]KAJ5430380.1 hypothetical protein N7491_007396 [Penicillium cf. griseofulvum]KAJ5435850.1 hypothetical protein N7445_006735 [Penicillium cf. griseofulvum]
MSSITQQLSAVIHEILLVVVSRKWATAVLQIRSGGPLPQRWPTFSGDYEADATATLSPRSSEIDDRQSLHALRQA